MRNSQQILSRDWTRPRAMMLLVVCLVAGTAGGWLLRGLPKAGASRISGCGERFNNPGERQALGSPNAWRCSVGRHGRRSGGTLAQ